jgi:thiamine-monophosphate kinase
VLTRSGAAPGDDLWLSGAVGTAAAGLGILRAGGPRHDVESDGALTQAFLLPEPRIRLGGLAGRTRAASACIDLSDGLADGLRQLAHSSGLGVDVDAAAIPVMPAAAAWFVARGLAPIPAAIRGGDDYELLLTVSRRQRARFAALRRLVHDVPLTRIGRTTSEPGVWLTVDGVRTPMGAGYEHFR